MIVDDHEVVRQGVRNVLAHARPQWEICGEAADGSQAIDATQRLQPDVVILDITMPKMSGLEAAARIAKLPGNFRILIFTMHGSERIDSDVRSVGAHGYVQKSQAGRDLVAAIDSLLAGRTFFAGKGEAKSSKSGDKPIPVLAMCEALCCSWKKTSAWS